MHLGNQNKTTKENGSFYYIGLLVLIVAVALFLLNSCSSATPSIIQMHNHRVNNAQPSESFLDVFDHLSIGVEFNSIETLTLPAPSDSLEYRQLPYNFFSTFKMIRPYFGVSIGLSMEHFLNANLTLGYYQFAQTHFWVGALGKPFGVAFTVNPIKNFLLGFGTGMVNVYYENLDGAVVGPRHSVDEMYREQRITYELGYKLFNYLQLSGKYEHSNDFNYEVWSGSISFVGPIKKLAELL